MTANALTVKDLDEAIRVLEKGNTPGTPEFRERFELWLKVLNGEACYWHPPFEFLVNGGGGEER